MNPRFKMKKWVLLCIGIIALIVAATVIANPAAQTYYLDFSNETAGAPPTSFVPIVGPWLIGVDGENKVLSVDGRKWKQGQISAGIAEQAQSLYGERYAEFLNNVKAHADYPFAVARGVDDFQQGEVSFRFKGLDGRIDQAAGILFDLKPNGNYLTLRANCLEDNLILWAIQHGKRTNVKEIRNTPTPSRQWHELKLMVKGNTLEGYLDGKLYLTHEIEKPVSGKVGVWSKADSVVYFDDFKVKPADR